MTYNIVVNFQHPANAGILAYIKKSPRAKRYGKQGKSGKVEEAADSGTLPNLSPDDHPDHYMLGTHPDLIMRLWDELPRLLPQRCQWIINEWPMLVHPASGIIFGFAQGTGPHALRLPPRERQEALEKGAKRIASYPGSTFDLDIIGADWVFGGWSHEEELWCLAAYEFAGTL